MNDFRCAALKITKDKPEEKRALFSVYTGIDGKPFSIEVWLENVTIQHRDDFICFGVKISGCRHPYDGLKENFNYFGEEQKNPALLQALRHSQTIIGAIIDDALSVNEIRRSLPMHKIGNYALLKLTPTGAEINLHFNDTLIPDHHPDRMATFKELVPFFKSVTGSIASTIPDIQDIIYENTHLQPVFPPSHEDYLAFASTIAGAWYGAAQRAGIAPGQMSGRDGLGDGPRF